MLILINKGKNITPIGGLIDQLDVTPYSTIDGDTSAKDYLMKPWEKLDCRIEKDELN